jgi:hypothetical protein
MQKRKRGKEEKRKRGKEEKRKRGKEEKRKCPMDEHVEATILFGIYLGGTVASPVGVFMWQGPWAALAAVGLLAVLFAMSQTIVMATNVGARTILRAISGAGRYRGQGDIGGRAISGAGR